VAHWKSFLIGTLFTGAHGWCFYEVSQPTQVEAKERLHHVRRDTVCGSYFIIFFASIILDLIHACETHTYYKKTYSALTRG